MFKRVIQQHRIVKEIMKKKGFIFKTIVNNKSKYFS